MARGGTKYNQEEFQKYLNRFVINSEVLAKIKYFFTRSNTQSSMLEMDDLNINIQKFIIKDDATLTVSFLFIIHKNIN